MRKPTAAGLLRFALAILVVVAVISLAASLPLIGGGEGVGLPQLRGLPTLGIDPTLIVWIFGFGSIILFFIALLVYRPWAGRRTLRGILPLVIVVSTLIFMSYLVRPAFLAPDEATDGGGAGGGSDDTGTEDPTDEPGSGSEDGEGRPAGEGDGTNGEGSGSREGEEGGDGSGTPGEGEAGAGGGEPATGGETNVPTGDPAGTGDTAPESGDPGPGGGEASGPGTLWERFLQASPLVAGVLVLIFAFVAFVAIHILRGTIRARRALAAAEGPMPSERLRGELLAALEDVAAFEDEGTQDVRSVILASYGLMMNLFRSHGLRPGHHLTAREVEVLALRSLGLSPPATRELRRLFEEARYSGHPLGDVQRRGAIESLRRVRHELAA